MQHRRRRERPGQEHDVRVDLADVGEQSLPEPQWLGVRVVDPEDTDVVVDPVRDDAQHLEVQVVRVVVEVERVDLLVRRGRVLRVRDGAVGAGGEPFRVLGDPRMVGGALQGEVERHLEVELAGPLDEGVEVVEGAQLGMHGVMSALRRPDRPRRARVVRTRRPGRCRGPGDGSRRSGGWAAGRRRRTHGGHGLQPLGRRAERARLHRAVGPDLGALGPREHLVPGADEGALRSTNTGKRSLAPTWSRTVLRSNVAMKVNAVASRSTAGTSISSRSSATMAHAGSVSVPRRSRAAPSARVSSTSTSAAIRAWASRTQAAIGSCHDSMRNVHGPTASALTAAAQWSLSRWVIRTGSGPVRRARSG